MHTLQLVMCTIALLSYSGSHTNLLIEHLLSDLFISRVNLHVYFLLSKSSYFICCTPFHFNSCFIYVHLLVAMIFLCVCMCECVCVVCVCVCVVCVCVCV